MQLLKLNANCTDAFNAAATLTSRRILSVAALPLIRYPLAHPPLLLFHSQLVVSSPPPTAVGIMSMFVVKRNGQKQPVQFDKITARIVKLCYGLNNDFVDPILVAQKVTAGTNSTTFNMAIDIFIFSCSVAVLVYTAFTVLCLRCNNVALLPTASTGLFVPYSTLHQRLYVLQGCTVASRPLSSTSSLQRPQPL
jgi:hypothetical protein